MCNRDNSLRLGIDLGTGSLKLIAYCGGRAFSASRKYEILSPASGVAETDPEEWIRALSSAWKAVRAQLLEAQIPLDTTSIGLSGQMHGFVPISKSGKALHNAILWADVRGAEYAEMYSRLLNGAFDRLLNAPAAGLTALILLWLKHSKPDLYKRTAFILFPKDYLRYRLTGHIGTDAGDASATLLWDFKAHSWSQEAFNVLGLESSKLPPVLDSFSVGGFVTGEASRETGLPEGVPVAVGSADKSCEIYGSGFFNDYFEHHTPRLAASGPGSPVVGVSVGEPATDADWQQPHIAQVSIGTGIQVVIPVRGIPPYSPALNFFETCVAEVGYRMAAMLNGGLALEWVLSVFNGNWETIYRDLGEGKTQLPQDLIFLPYLTGERSPYQNSKARGAWIGLGLHHSRTDMLASALLGVACTIRLGIETLGIAREAKMYCIGGSTRYPVWMSIVSAMVGRRLLVSPEPDASVRGAAAIGFEAAAGAGAAHPGDYTHQNMPEPLETSPVESEQPGWMNEYYKRFKMYYERLFGEEKTH
ncbi:MAG: xylulokinase [Rectinema sp.]